jgi:hypothetical protein
MRGKDVYISGGYVERVQGNYIPSVQPEQEWEFNQKQLQEFREICNMLEKRNIKLVLVYAPITKSLYNSYLNNEVFDREIVKYGRYYDFNKILNLNDSLHFYDDDHLNQKGVEIFNKKMLSVKEIFSGTDLPN